jgi:hypothetical protein
VVPKLTSIVELFTLFLLRVSAARYLGTELCSCFDLLTLTQPLLLYSDVACAEFLERPLPMVLHNATFESIACWGTAGHGLLELGP